ncbi:hypothetical protein CDAR_243731 [Caerostris darwini]|uniref:Uncharacterized protein n=1 Tax=Caerostris darwini TaxID=1538125 RepID=A0AAV4VD81_9ARAC|nr:hypothetical protein CDAR_243731 [Caerostris darwini]
MEIIKRNKTAQRAAFTKVYTKLESVLINENANAGEIELCLHLLKQKTGSLELTHNEYLDALTDETEFMTEFNIVEEYREKALIMEFKSKRVLEKIKSKQNNNESSHFGDNSHLAVCENPYKNTSPRLPELELYKFGGELRNWLTFWNQFKSIHENKNLTNCDTFHYLVQWTKIKSEARDLIESFPITHENYPLAIESLTERYGRKERYCEEFPKKLQDSFYVDNCVTSVQNNAELEIFVESATNVMKEGMLDRRGCESSALSASSESTRSPVLGLILDKNLDTLEIDSESLEFDEREKITKRKILSLVSQVFDPTDFLAPVRIQPKILLQATWKTKESWNDEVNNEIKKNFLKWRKQFKYFKNIKIPRWLSVMKKSNLSIHTFVDVSKTAYAACIFLRSEFRVNEIRWKFNTPSMMGREGINKAARKSTGKISRKRWNH